MVGRGYVVSDLTAVSLFAGIGGIDLALKRAGVNVVAAVEIDPECRGVLARHFPHTALFNDVTEVTGDQLIAAGFVPGRGILAGGSPCQDLSIAGRRTGLGGARSGLFWRIMRLADELHPRWLLFENVPGLLSAVCSCSGDETCLVNGRAVRCGRWEKRDGERAFIANVAHVPEGGACPGGCMGLHGGAMGTVLGAVGKRWDGVAYRVLDAQFFGVPQRRSRVFIAGCLGDRAAPVRVLLEPESGEGNPAARGPARQGDPRHAQDGAGDARTVGTLGTTGPGGGWRLGADEAAAGQLVVSTLQGGGRRGHRIDAEGAAGGHLVAVPVALRGRDAGSQIEAGEAGEAAFTVRASTGGSSHAMVATFGSEGVDHALTSEGADASEDGTGRGTPIVAYALTSRNDRNDREENWVVAAPSTPDAPPMALAENQRGEVIESAVHHQLTTGGGKPAQGYPAVRTGTAVRRLSPRECERLQGLPDDWTRWLADGSEQSDSARYREIGNSVAVPVAEWITRRIVAAEARLVAARGAA